MIVKPSINRQILKDRKDYLKYAATKPAGAAGSITFVAAGPYLGNSMSSPREGANDAHTSLPMSAQIKVRTV